MPNTTVTAKEGDTLCGLAIAAGFLDCDPLRALGENSAFLNRDLQPGDVITIPELQLKEENKSSGAKHPFTAKNAPPVSIRFVHGSPDKPYRQDDTTTFLNISNYVTNKAGLNGQAALPTATVFNNNAHVDLDTFKVEVVDPAGPGNVDVLLEAMKPVFAPDGTLLRHEPFTGADHGARSLTVSTKKVPSGVCYRSPYLRLVANEADQAAVPAQTLLITDKADGLNGDNDKLEILEQQVRASYVRTKCPAAAPNKCTVRAQVPIAPDRARIRVAFHVFRPAAGAGTTGVNGVNEQMVRRRTFKWFRRLYAQAGLAPKIVANFVFLDPPRANMLVISNDHGRAATGVQATGAASTLSFTLSVPPGSPPFPGTPTPPDPVITINLTAAMTPTQAGAAVVAALPAGFTGQAFTNARAFNAPDASCDVLIRRADGNPVIIRNEVCNDAQMTVVVPRFNITAVNVDAPAASLISCTPEQRRVVRESPGSDDRLDFYVTGGLTNAAGAIVARGIAMVPGTDLPAAFQAPAPIRFGALMGPPGAGGHTLDGTDNNPFSFPHEAGHVLNDAFHCDTTDQNFRTQMMRAGTSVNDAVDASKRICDTPLLVRYDAFTPNPAVQAATPGTSSNQTINAVQRMRARGAQVIEPF
jgi:hypothetical protein